MKVQMSKVKGFQSFLNRAGRSLVLNLGKSWFRCCSYADRHFKKPKDMIAQNNKNVASSARTSL